MKQYLDLGKKILETGDFAPGRAGSETYSLFGEQLKFDLMDGFPIPTTQHVQLKPMAAELIWILSGSTNNNDLVELGANFWTPWALKEPITSDRQLSGYDRAAKLAQLTNRSIGDTIKYLNGMSYDDAQEALTAAAVPETEPVVRVAAGELGPVYGRQWRDFGGVDQIRELVNNLQTQPYSRRHVISGWNPTVLPIESHSHEQNIADGKQVLPCCHALWQVYVRPATKAQAIKYLEYQRGGIGLLSDEDINFHIRNIGTLVDQDLVAVEAYLNANSLPTKRLSLQLYARSQDYPVGTVVNIPSYALLTHLLALTINAIPGDYIHTMGDVHVYANQVEKFKQQLEREPRQLPKLKIHDRWLVGCDWVNGIANRQSPFDNTVNCPTLERFYVDDFELVGYNPHERITYKVLV